MQAMATLLLLNLAAWAVQRRTRCGPSAALLLVTVSGLCGLWLGAVLGILRPAALGLALCCPVLFACAFAGPKPAAAADLRAWLTPTLVLTHAAAGVFAVCYGAVGPRFYYWDEYSFWGMAARILHETDALYTAGATAFLVDETYPCGSALLSYLFGLFGPFSEGGLYLSYAVLCCIVFGAAAECIAARRGQKAGMLAFCALLLSPFLLGYHRAAADYTSPVYGYGTAMPDTLLAAAALGALALYFAFARRGSGCFAALPALAFTAMLKDAGVFFALLAGCVIAVFALGDGARTPAARLAGCLAVLAAGPAVYLAWQRHLAGDSLLWLPAVLAGLWLAGRFAPGLQRRLPAVRPRTCALVAGALVLAALVCLLAGWPVLVQKLPRTVRYWLVPETRSMQFNLMLDAAVTAFFTERTLLPLPDVWLCMLLLAVWLAAAALPGRIGRARLQLALCGAGFVAGGLVYAAVVVSAMTGFYHHGLMEYGRYLSPFYLLFFWATVLVPGCMPAGDARLYRLAVAAAALVALGVTANIGLDHTLLASPDVPWAGYTRLERELAGPRAAMETGSRVYLMVDSGEYNQVRYCLYPVGIAGAPKCETCYDFAEPFAAHESYGAGFQVAAPAEYAALLAENFDYLLVRSWPQYYQDSYGHLFAGGLQPGLYRIDPAAGACFVPVEVRP